MNRAKREITCSGNDCLPHRQRASGYSGLMVGHLCWKGRWERERERKKRGRFVQVLLVSSWCVEWWSVSTLTHTRTHSPIQTSAMGMNGTQPLLVIQMCGKKKKKERTRDKLSCSLRSRGRFAERIERPMNLKALIWIFAAYSFALFKYIQVQEKKSWSGLLMFLLKGSVTKL